MPRALVVTVTQARDDYHMVAADLCSELQTVTRLQDACRIGHRTTRAYSEWRRRGRAGAIVSAAAYPLMWAMYTAMVSLEAHNTIPARVYRVKGGKTRREVAEQRMINRRGGISKLQNKKNPIGPKRQHLMKQTGRNVHFL